MLRLPAFHARLHPPLDGLEGNLGLYLASIHNLHFLLDTMRQIRESIFAGTFETLKAEMLSKQK